MAVQILGLIPARFASQRFPGKPLALLKGARGDLRPLIQRSWDAACAAIPADRCWVATDDPRIADVVRDFGGQVILTPATCRNGTERCAAAIEVLAPDPQTIIVNVQGDAPLMPADVIRDLADLLANDPDTAMVTPAIRCSPALYRHLHQDAQQGRVGGTTVVFTRDARALYFSKHILPFGPSGRAQPHADIHLHMGLYAYRPAGLRAYQAAAPSRLETLEGLEQLRFLDMGLNVRILVVPPPKWDVIELNNPDDVPMIEAVLRHRGLD